MDVLNWMPETDMEKNKRNLRIVYMGTPEFAVAGLRKLLDENYKVVGVITAPDRPAGRGQKLRESDVKKFAKQEGITILQPTNLKNESFLDELKRLNANLQVVVAFRMLPKVVWQMPEYGTFNLHASLLPQYRGAAPINWAIMNGETVTGVTTFFIDEKIDTGEIILQEKTKIKTDENAGQLHDRLMVLGAETILNTVRLIEMDDVSPKKQEEQALLKSANKIDKDTCRIDWNLTSDEIYNHIRGLSPYPASWTVLVNGEKQLPLKIYSANVEKGKHHFDNGFIISTKEQLKVAVKDGFLLLSEVQLAGKKRMLIEDLLNGFKLNEGAFLL